MRPTHDLTTVRMRICDREHPHYPERGFLTGKVITMRFSGEHMAEMRLEHCQHGTEGCFVSKGQIERDR